MMIASIISCAPAYYPIEPLSINFEEGRKVEVDSNLTIIYKYDIQKESGNNKYARIEKRNGLSLLALLIINESPDTLFVPQDIIFLDQEYPIEALELEELEILTQLYEKGSEKESAVDFEWPWWVTLTNGAGFLLSGIPADTKFMHEMEEYYLVYSYVEPGAQVSGLIALPIERNTPLAIQRYTAPDP